jgi:hypothetical protein
MTDLDRVAQPAAAPGFGPGAPGEAPVVSLGKHYGGLAVARQHCEKPVELFSIEAEARRELPQKRAELLLQPQDPGGEEIGERGFDVAQLLHMGDEAAALDGEDETVRRLVMPAREGFGALQRVMRAVDLDRVDMPAGIGQLVGLSQLLRVEAAAPAGIAPAGDADPDPTIAGCPAGCGGAAHGLAPASRDKSRAC